MRIDSSATGYEPRFTSSLKGCGSRDTSRVRLHLEAPKLLRPLSLCWTEGPGSIVIVIPSLEPAAAVERQVAIWSGAELQQRLLPLLWAKPDICIVRRTSATTTATTTPTTSDVVLLCTFGSEPWNASERNVGFDYESWRFGSAVYEYVRRWSRFVRPLPSTYDGVSFDC